MKIILSAEARCPIRHLVHKGFHSRRQGAGPLGLVRGETKLWRHWRRDVAIVSRKEPWHCHGTPRRTMTLSWYTATNHDTVRVNRDEPRHCHGKPKPPRTKSRFVSYPRPLSRTWLAPWRIGREGGRRKRQVSFIGRTTFVSVRRQD